MEDIIERQSLCPGYDAPSNCGRENDRHAMETVLQDKLVDCLFQMELENASCSTLDTLLNQLDEVAPLPNDKSFDTEDSLTKLYQKISARSANQVPASSSQRRASLPYFYEPCVSVPQVSHFCTLEPFVQQFHTLAHRPMREPLLCTYREQQRGIWGSCRRRTTIFKAGSK